MSDQHLHPETIAHVARGRLRGAERAAAIAHTDGCDECRADLTYVIGFERRRRRRRVAAFAGGIGVVALGIAIIPSGPALQVDPETVRGGDEGISRVESYLPANGAEVDSDTVRFVWQDMGMDTHYTFRLSTATGAPVLEQAVRDTTLYLAVSLPLEPGGAYLWLVDALLADGDAATSPVWRFTIPE